MKSTETSKSRMPLVIIESPFAANAVCSVEQHIAYARRAVADSLRRGEAPIASHLLYTQPGILNDLDPDERAAGIAAGLAWLKVAERQIFYCDHGMSGGMQQAFVQGRHASVPYEFRYIGREKS